MKSTGTQGNAISSLADFTLIRVNWLNFRLQCSKKELAPVDFRVHKNLPGNDLWFEKFYRNCRILVQSVKLKYRCPTIFRRVMEIKCPLRDSRKRSY